MGNVYIDRQGRRDVRVSIHYRRFQISISKIKIDFLEIEETRKCRRVLNSDANLIRM